MATKDLVPFFHKTLIVFAVAALAGLVILLSDILLIVFGSVLIALILHATSHPIRTHMRVSQRWALFFAIIIIISIIFIISAMLGSIVTTQVNELGKLLPGSWSAFKLKLGEYQYGDMVAVRLEAMRSSGMGQGVGAKLSSAAFSLADAIANFLIAVVGGIFIAAQPALYKNGLLGLIPKKPRANVREAMEHAGRALKLWFIGKLISMACIGVLASIVFLSLGLPSGLALGLIAGAGEFIPFVGSFIALIPALLLASTQGPEMMFWVLVCFVAVQQFQGNVIMPLVQQRMVNLPPALTIFSLVTFAVLFGVGGVLLAEPLTVLFFVLVKKLYVRDVLGEKTLIPGEKIKH